jgi:endonuclease III
MAKRLKLDQALEVLSKAHGKPRTAGRPEDPLLDHLLVGVLSFQADEERAARAVKALGEAFLDLNEVRVSPLAELASVLEPSLGDASWEGAVLLRNALQDVFEGTHGLDLEPLRGREPEDQRKFLKELPHTLGGPAAAVFQLAVGEDRLALPPAEQRVLGRLGLLPRSANPVNVRKSLERQVKGPDRIRFAWAFGSHAAYPCRKVPLCETCPVLDACPHGEREMKLRALHRKKEDLKRAVEEKRRKEVEAKRARVEAKAAAAAAKKKAVEDAKTARLAAIEKRKREAIDKAKRLAHEKAEKAKAKKKEAAERAKAAARAKAKAKKRK